MTILSTLNDKQREAASITDSHVRIIAGAGSGKTRVLMARIVYLIQECGVYPNRIMAITFTNKATNEMKERLTASLGKEALAVRISTIHSLCVRILREDARSIGYPTSFTILDTDDQKQLLRPIYKELDLDSKEFNMSYVLGMISGYKSEKLSPKQAMDYAMTDQQETIVKIYSQYEKKRLEIKAMDFDDLLIEALRLLETDPKVKEKWQNRLDYIHVDEFQDVDPIQYAIVRHLVGPHAFLCVVGDPDQTIYTWRGASVDIILHFDRDFQPCKSVILNQNYRSTKPILDASNALIQNNRDRIKKDLFTEIPGNDKIILHIATEDSDEPVYIARKIHERHQQGIAYKDMAVLYRSNYSSRAFERVFKSVRIPYKIYGGIRFYERQEIKDALAYLKLCTFPEPEDPKQLSFDLAILRIINQPRRGIGQKTIEKLRDQAQSLGVNLLTVLKDPQDLSSGLKKKCQDFYALIYDLQQHRDTLSLEDFLEYVIEKSGYRQMLEENHETERLDNLKELKSDIAQSLKEDPAMTLESYLQEVSLFTSKASDEALDCVSFMTVHASKGLEFDTVFIVNFNEGIFPSSRSLNEGGNKALEEERRLCYVAMTRAKTHLTISWNTGFSYMLDTFKTKSRFMMEIPAEECFMEGQKNHEKKEERQIQSIGIPSRKKKVEFKVKDRVEHKVFGPGIVLKIEREVATIAFKHPYGIKQLNATHPSLKKSKS